MKTVKMTIDIPAPLKDRMDLAGNVNWGGIACEAFGNELDTMGFLRKLAGEPERDLMAELAQIAATEPEPKPEGEDWNVEAIASLGGLEWK
jgi:hypothetical protein